MMVRLLLGFLTITSNYSFVILKTSRLSFTNRFASSNVAHNSTPLKLVCKSADDIEYLGEKFGKKAIPGDIFLLEGYISCLTLT